MSHSVSVNQTIGETESVGTLVEAGTAAAMATYSATKEFANRQVKPFVCPKIPKLNCKVTKFLFTR